MLQPRPQSEAVEEPTSIDEPQLIEESEQN